MTQNRIVDYTIFVCFAVLLGFEKISAQINHIHKLEGEGFVTVLKGESIHCKQVSGKAYSDLRLNQKTNELQVIRRTDLEGVQRQKTSGLTIVLRSTSQLDSYPQAKEAFIKAAAKWESLIASPITIIIDVDFGATRFGIPFPQGVVGATQPQLLGGGELYEFVRTALIDRHDVNERQRSIFNRLPDVLLPTDSGATSAMLGTSANFRAMGIISPVADPINESMYGELPSVGFNSTFPFDFDPSDGIDVGKIDFNAVAVHELGHVLGFLSMAGIRELAPSNSNYIAIWDMFRFNRGMSLDKFSTEQRRILSGGEAVHFSGLNEIMLATGVNEGADGSQTGHWKDDFYTGQYLGIMDPTLSLGKKDEVTINDLTALEDLGYKIRSEFNVYEALSVDDNSPDAKLLPSNDALYVTRHTPSRYPARVDSVRIAVPYDAILNSNPMPSIRIVVFGASKENATPPDNPYYLYDQTFTMPEFKSTRFIELTIDGPVFSSGDIYIGIQSPIEMYVDTTPSNIGERSYVGVLNNEKGGGFKPLILSENSRGGNLFIRTLISNPIAAVPVPEIISASPDTITFGSEEFVISVFGRNFISGSTILWNGSPRNTRFKNGSEIEAQISASDIFEINNAVISVLNPGGSLARSYSIDIGSINPVPVASYLDWKEIASKSAPTNINVFGRNFVPGAKVKIGDEYRPTAFINSTRLMVSLFSKDYAELGEKHLTVVNPGPGGGASSELILKVVNCEFSLSETVKQYTAVMQRDGKTSPEPFQAGVFLNTHDHCWWSVLSDVAWIKIDNPVTGSGWGKYVINYTVEPNLTNAERTGNIVVGGQTLKIKQSAFL